MRTAKFKAYVHPSQKLSMVYVAILAGWVIKKHRKDGKVSSRFAMCFGPGIQRDVAIRRVRTDQHPIPASGWIKSNVKGRWKSADQVHEAAYVQSTTFDPCKSEY